MLLLIGITSQAQFNLEIDTIFLGNNDDTLFRLRYVGTTLYLNGDEIDLSGSLADMTKAVYDPQTIEGDAFARANHTGTQAQSTVVGLVDTLGVHLDTLQALRVDVNSGGTYLDISDTATMLTPYIERGDTANMLAYINTDIAEKVNISDTNTMLTPYITRGDTADMLTYINTDISDLQDTIAVHLDTLQALRVDVNTTPTLDEVTTSGATTTNDIEIGNLTVNAEFTSNNSFGELYDPSTVISTATTNYYTLSGWTAGAYNEATLDTDSTILVAQAGTYRINFSMSFTHATVSTVVHICAFNSTDNTEFTNIETERKIGTGGDVGSVSGTGLVVLSANDKVCLRAKADKTGNLTVSHGNFNITRIK